MIEDIQAQVSRMADAAWAAGVLDVRGEFVAYPRKDVKGGYIVRVRIRVGRHHGRDFLDWIESVLGGRVRYDKGHVEWQASGVAGVLDVLDLVHPHLRRQARRSQMLRELCVELDDRSRPFAERSLTPAKIKRRRELHQALAYTRQPRF